MGTRFFLCTTLSWMTPGNESLYAFAPSVCRMTCWSCKCFLAMGSHSRRRMGPGLGDRGFVGEGYNRKSVIVFGWPRSTRPPTSPISKTSHPHRALCLVPPHLPPHHTISPPCHRQCPSPSSPHVAHGSPLSWRRFERPACHPCLRWMTLLSQALQLTRTQERLLGDQEQ